MVLILGGLGVNAKGERKGKKGTLFHKIHILYIFFMFGDSISEGRRIL